MSKSGEHRWRGKLPIPRKAHPLVRALYQHANEQQTTLTEIARRAGVPRRTISDWTQNRSPGVALLVACFHVLDLDLVPQERERTNAR